MKKYFIHFLISALILYGDEVIGQITFQKSLGGALTDNARSLIQTQDGGYLITGPTTSFGDTSLINIYLIKTDEFGDTLWTKAYYDSSNAYPYCVSKTNDKGYIISGTSNAKNDAFLLKVSFTGSLWWFKVIGSTSSPDALYSCQTTSSGDYIATGFTNTVAGTNDVFVVKTDNAGNIIWSKSYGGFFSDKGYSIKETSSGDYIICGETSSSGGQDMYIVRIDTNGIPVWSYSYGGLSVDIASDIVETSDSNFVVAGNTLSYGAGSFDIVLMKISSTGTPLWTKTYGGRGDDKCTKVIHTSDNGFMITGLTMSFGAGLKDAYVIKTDSSGNLLWSHVYGGVSNEIGYCLVQTMDGNYAITGAESSFGAGWDDVYLLKMDSAGYTGCNEGSAATVVSSWNISTNTHAMNSLNAGSVFSRQLQFDNGALTFSNCISTDADEHSASETRMNVQVYPNPFTGIVYLNSNNQINISSVIIYNSLGSTLTEYRDVNQREISFDLSGYAKGVYIVKVFQDRNYTVKRIMLI
jgi:hypothetical protein